MNTETEDASDAEKVAPAIVLLCPYIVRLTSPPSVVVVVTPPAEFPSPEIVIVVIELAEVVIVIPEITL